MLNDDYPSASLTEVVRAGIPISQTVHVMRINLGDEITYRGSLIRAQLNGYALKVSIWVDSGLVDSFGRIYKTITGRYARFALLLRNDPMVLIVDCDDTYKRPNFGLIFQVPTKEELSGCCGCGWNDDDQDMFQPWIVHGATVLSQDALGTVKHVSNMYQVTLSFDASRPGGVHWRRQQIGCANWCLTILCFCGLWPVLIKRNHGDDFPTSRADAYNTFNMSRITLKQADCHNELRVFA